MNNFPACKNCRFLGRSELGTKLYVCHNSYNEHDAESYYDGRIKVKTYNSIEFARNYDSLCGRTGKWFQAIPLWEYPAVWIVAGFLFIVGSIWLASILAS